MTKSATFGSISNVRYQVCTICGCSYPCLEHPNGYVALQDQPPNKRAGDLVRDDDKAELLRELEALVNEWHHSYCGYVGDSTKRACGNELLKLIAAHKPAAKGVVI